MSKYIDLAEKLARMHDLHPGTIRVALGLLDKFAAEHPDQMPGRTMTQTRFDQAVDIALDSGEFDAEEFARQLGITVAPEPEPTNAEKLAKEMLTSFNKCEFDFESSFEQLAKALDARGIKAPGGDDRSEPYTPSDEDLIGCWARASQRAGREAHAAEAEARRGIAKIKAEALREAADRIRVVNAVRSADESAYHHGTRYGQKKVADWLDDRASRVEVDS